MYDPHHTKAFYDAYGTAEWDRLQATAYGRLKAIAHTDFIHSYLKPGDMSWMPEAALGASASLWRGWVEG